MSLTLRGQLSSTLWSRCRWLLDPYLDDDSSSAWYASDAQSKHRFAVGQDLISCFNDFLQLSTSDHSHASTSSHRHGSASTNANLKANPNSMADPIVTYDWDGRSTVHGRSRHDPTLTPGLFHPELDGHNPGASSTIMPAKPKPEARYVVTWPKSQIPVEIFELITSNLNRVEVKEMRLVCREFEDKISSSYFKNVVVPFRSELYGALTRNEETGALQHPSSAFFSSSRMFESFGPHILRFALSLELEEHVLAYPPVKPFQEACSAYWGIYRWPHKNYNRYSDLEGIEQTADETQAMKEALRSLTKVTNLGLCCDAGLGFLIHPDIIARRASTEHPVFATQDWRRKQRSTPMDSTDDNVIRFKDFNGRVRDNAASFTLDSAEGRRNMLEEMVKEAGYKGDEQVDEAIELLLETENKTLASIDLDGRKRNVIRNRSTDYPPIPDVAFANDVPIMDERRSPNPHNSHADSESRPPPLVPAVLSRAQKELLLELEWAHRAMIQSYVIAITDNAMLGCYSTLTTLTIAKIPSSHVHILYRHDFWKCFPNLTTVSLGVIADWRRIGKPAPGLIDDIPVSPVEAVGKVFTLLNSYIGVQPGIESLHFEWICGGEFAPSSFQRNQYVLPAPFLARPDHMTARFGAALDSNNVLSLPHVKHLSLKNCWSTPHVLMQTVRQMALSSLEKLELESVSMTGALTAVPQTPLHPLGMHIDGGGLHQITQAHHAHVQAMHPAGPPVGQLNAAVFVENPNVDHVAHVHGQAQAHTQLHAHIQAHHQAAQAQAHAQAHAQAQNDGNGGAVNGIHPNLPGGNGFGPHDSPDSVQCPEWMTWSGFMEHFSPSVKIRDLLQREDDEPGSVNRPWQAKLREVSHTLHKPNHLVKDERRYKLRCLTFKSCGYIAVDAPTLNTRALLPGHPPYILAAPFNEQYSALHTVMQKSKDRMMGRIIPYLKPQELFNLTEAFGMTPGWDMIYPQQMIDDARADGIECPGMGRFSGTIDTAGGSSWGLYLPDDVGFSSNATDGSLDSES